MTEEDYLGGGMCFRLWLVWIYEVKIFVGGRKYYVCFEEEAADFVFLEKLTCANSRPKTLCCVFGLRVSSPCDFVRRMCLQYIIYRNLP